MSNNEHALQPSQYAKDRGNKIQMYPSGKLVDPFNLNTEDIEIEDIAHHLSRICRWNGGVPGFYSVAEHSQKVAGMVDRRHAKWALLHDAGEAYLTDVARPIKPRMLCQVDPHDKPMSLKQAEDNILKVIAEKYDLQWPMPAEVIRADDIRCAEENLLIKKHQLHGNKPNMAQTRFMHAWRAVQKWS